MDYLKLFCKSKNQVDSLVHIFSQNVGIMERGKVIRTDGIRRPDREHMKDIDETAYTYLGILETDKIKEKDMKEKFSKEYLR